ncbi:hypothetical protein LWI29_008023 [Acer saccharum]|uniref:Integrase catalytic domain-containing protein n=1 Tax=Acer saccharum TaxID=4024 RepID=A0AA39SRZ6_ACESA|nr:hypothetical protein LWI29_008023 [Acer saccharum]
MGPRRQPQAQPPRVPQANISSKWLTKERGLSCNLKLGSNLDRVQQRRRIEPLSSTKTRTSGCSRHMTGNKSFFETLVMEEGGYVTFGDGSKKKEVTSGREFENASFESYCDSLGISHEFSAPRTPQQNGVVERKNRVLQEMARVMLLSNNVPRNLWAEAINTACYIGNRVFLRPGTRNTSYELWKGKRPNVSYFHTFGSKCYILNDRDQLGKFDAKSDEGIFIGYALNSRAYRVFN